MHRLDYPLVRTGDAAFAAGITHPTLLGWIDRGLFTLTDIDQDSPGSGVARLFSLRRVYQLGIVAELAGLRIPVRFGAAIASHFSDSGGEGRGPGQLYATGPTFLISGWPALAASSVVNHNPPPQEFACVAINVRNVVAAVNGRLRERGVIIPQITGPTTDTVIAGPNPDPHDQIQNALGR
jgi:hypothetical protein